MLYLAYCLYLTHLVEGQHCVMVNKTTACNDNMPQGCQLECLLRFNSAYLLMTWNM